MVTKAPPWSQAWVGLVARVRLVMRPNPRCPAGQSSMGLHSQERPRGSVLCESGSIQGWRSKEFCGPCSSIVKLLCGAVAMCWLMPAVVVTLDPDAGCQRKRELSSWRKTLLACGTLWQLWGTERPSRNGPRSSWSNISAAVSGGPRVQYVGPKCRHNQKQ